MAWDDLIGSPAMDYSFPSTYGGDWQGFDNWLMTALPSLSYSDYWPGGGMMGAGGDLLYDTWTGQFITSAQAQQIDPTAFQEYSDVASRYYDTQMAGGTTSLEQSGAWPTGTADPTSAGGGTTTPWTWQDIAKYGIGGISALGGLGALGLGVASMFGGTNAANRTTTQSSSTQQNPLPPGALALLGTPGTLGTPGVAGAPGTPGTPGTGIYGLAEGAMANLGGPQGLLAKQGGLLSGLPGQIPQLNPAITGALQSQAQGMAQGMLPALNDPAAQARIRAIYQPGFDALNYNAGLALDNAKEALQGRGFAVPDIREGPTQALTAPILAAQQLGRSQLYGQMAGAQLDLASRLPMQAAQLAAQEYGLRQFPFNASLQAAQAYDRPIATQGQIPLSLLDILARQSGTTSTVNTVGPQPSLTQQLGQLAPVIGAAGGMLGTAGNIMFPPQRSSYSGIV
jgi:hypothetical protein